MQKKKKKKCICGAIVKLLTGSAVILDTLIFVLPYRRVYYLHSGDWHETNLFLLKKKSVYQQSVLLLLIKSALFSNNTRGWVDAEAAQEVSADAAEDVFLLPYWLLAS